MIHDLKIKGKTVMLKNLLFFSLGLGVGVLLTFLLLHENISAVLIWYLWIITLTLLFIA